jgi:transketolase
MRDAFLERVSQEMALDDKIFFLTADFGSPALDKIRNDFPRRFVNVGIAEQNLINLSAGLALEGYTVFAYAIAPFITMRCFEQIRVSLALLSEIRPMNVNLIGVGAGYSYVVSGPTHQCYEDISLMRALPNFRILSPSDHISAVKLFEVCINESGPKYLRFDAQQLQALYKERFLDANLGFHIHRIGKKICILATGFMVHTALKVADELTAMGIKAGVIDIFDITNFNIQELIEAIHSYDNIVSMEEGFRGLGGLDAKLFDIISRNKLTHKILNLGVEGRYRFEIGSREELHEMVGIGPKACLMSVIKFIESQL